jgi:hypothetical protein
MSRCHCNPPEQLGLAFPVRRNTKTGSFRLALWWCDNPSLPQRTWLPGIPYRPGPDSSLGARSRPTCSPARCPQPREPQSRRVAQGASSAYRGYRHRVTICAGSAICNVQRFATLQIPANRKASRRSLAAWLQVRSQRIVLEALLDSSGGASALLLTIRPAHVPWRAADGCVARPPGHDRREDGINPAGALRAAGQRPIPPRSSDCRLGRPRWRCCRRLKARPSGRHWRPRP